MWEDAFFFLTRHRKTFGFFIRLGKQQDIFEMNFFSRFYCLNGIRWKYNQTTQYRKHLDTFFPLEKSVKQYFLMCILLYITGYIDQAPDSYSWLPSVRVAAACATVIIKNPKDIRTRPA